MKNYQKFDPIEIKRKMKSLVYKQKALSLFKHKDEGNLIFSPKKCISHGVVNIDKLRLIGHTHRSYSFHRDEVEKRKMSQQPLELR